MTYYYNAYMSMEDDDSEYDDYESKLDEIYPPWIDTWEVGSDDPPEWLEDEE